MARKKFKRRIKVEEGSSGDNVMDSAQKAEKGGTVEAAVVEAVEAEQAADSSDLKESNQSNGTSSDVGVETSSNSEPDDLSLAKKTADENYDKYVRALADIENIKKSNLRERRELIMYAGENIARDMLDVVDSIELAVKQENKGSLEEFSKGIALILSQFQAVLERHGIKPSSLKGEKFDPEKAEALATVPVSDDTVGQVVEEFKKAYFFKDKLIRPAQVVVAKEGGDTVAADSESPEKDTSGKDKDQEEKQEED